MKTVQTHKETTTPAVTFDLDEAFLNKFKGQQPKWGPLGYITYKRTYARDLGNGQTEEYWQTTQRVVEGTYTIQKRHCIQNTLPWNEEKAQKSAQTMYQLMWDFKFTPPGRGLWMMGTPYVYKHGGAALNNCAFISTKDINKNFSEPFIFLMDMSMLGVGVGGDTKGEGSITIQQPTKSDEEHVVADTREGWVDLIKRTLDAYAGKDTLPKIINYDQVRPQGVPIKGFGGVASGPEPLDELQKSICTLLDKRIGKSITSADIVDIFNLIGRCVVAGNVRRTAEIMFGDPNDEEFMDLKNPELHKEECMHHRWASNNSIFAEVGMDYSDVAERTAKNGEPGYEWLGNAQAYSRMIDPKDWKDKEAKGGNPCLEQTLFSGETCCLVETYPSNHESLEEWQETLKYAYLYAKTVTLVMTHNSMTNRIIAKNRRIGCSMSGIVQAFKKFGRRTFLNAASDGWKQIQTWDKSYSDWLGIPKSIKTTSVKPSGTVSLLAGVTPGIHYPISEYYIRNIRFAADSPLLTMLERAGFKMEKDKYHPQSMVVSFPIKEKYFDRSVQEVTMWEQFENAAQIQAYWADNQVSVTISFGKKEAADIKNALELYETRLKGCSLLPKMDHGYEQAPYIPITPVQYNEMIKNVKEIEFIDGKTHEVTEKFCDGESCQI
ncbi:MAG: hypothetical protein OXR66_08305 [Candidatus Woesearchaeota archaeon]|nr:hypothetical protein [Candidatus Woesearchaeota archaeon]